MTTALTKFDDQITEMDRVVSETRPLLLAGDIPDVRRTLAVADGMERLEELLTGDVMKKLARLQGKEAGYLTDKKYADHELRDAMIFAMLNGAKVIGNEFNVIAGRCMLVKNFYKRALRELPGLENLRVVPGIPSIGETGAMVPFSATWTIFGTRDSLTCEKLEECDRRIPIAFKWSSKNSKWVRENVDQVKGKAERRFLKMIYERLIGSTFGEPDEDDNAVVEQAEPVAAIVPAPTKAIGWRQNAIDELNAAEEILAVNAVEDKYAPMAVDSADGAELAGMCDERRDQIRSSRGESTK